MRGTLWIVIIPAVVVLLSACGQTAAPSVAPTVPTPSGVAALGSPSPTWSPTPDGSPSPPPSPTVAPAASAPLPSPDWTEPPTPTLDSTLPEGAPAFRRGLLLTTVEDRVRVRSRPSTGAGSVKYEPVLPLDTALHTLEGPVRADGYWWYRVELSEPDQHLIGGTRSGWVAVADHDGTPWVDVLVDVDPGPPAPAVIRGWPSVRRGSVVLRGEAALESETGVSLPVEVHGLLPGTDLLIEAAGDYEVAWRCGGGPQGELGAAMTDAGTTTGGDTARARFKVGEDGVGRAMLELVADPPDTACPPDYPGPMVTWERHWTDLRLTAIGDWLEITPPPFDSADTL